MGTSDVLSWRQVDVDGVPTRYAVGGEGPPVLFLHGWALGTRAYRRPLRRLIRRGCRIYAPALPGLGGTADLAPHARTVAGYGWWAARFLASVGVSEPVIVIGHSFGGAVAIGMAHSQPDLVQYLVLLNAVGGGRWSGLVGDSRPLADRPLWDWAMHFAREAAVATTDVKAIRSVVPEVVGNLVRNPMGVWRSAHMARRANLTAELAWLRSRRIPVLALTSDADSVIPQAAFEALCAAIGTDGHVVAGRHSWLLTDPDSMGEVLANVVDVQVAEHRSRTNASRLEALDDLLSQTPMSAEDRRRLLDEASPLWLMSEDERTLAGDLALCTPPLEDGEVRAVVVPIEDSRLLRLTVVAHDRPGLLADTTAILAGEGLSILGASAITWARLGMALHSLTVEPDEHFSVQRWNAIGARLQQADGTPVPVPTPRSSAPVVRIHGQTEDRTLVTVEADDHLGTLAAICRWLADEGATIESLGTRSVGGRVVDSFVTRGKVPTGMPRLTGRVRPQRARTTAA